MAVRASLGFQPLTAGSGASLRLGLGIESGSAGGSMAKYLLSYHGGGMPESEEEGARVMAAWGEWMGSLGESMVDGGNPVGGAPFRLLSVS